MFAQAQPHPLAAQPLRVWYLALPQALVFTMAPAHQLSQPLRGLFIFDLMAHLRLHECM